MNRSPSIYVSALLAFSLFNPAYAQPSAIGSPPGINAIQSEYLVPDASLNVSEYEQYLMVPDTANSFINSITALGITYTVDDMKASLNKLKTKNVRASKQFLDNLLLADALLNEMRLRKGPSVVQGVPGIGSFNSPTGPSVAQGVPGIASFNSPPGVAQGVPGIASFNSPPGVAQGTPGIASFSHPVNLGAIAGTYRYEPYSNAWQEGTLEPTGDFRLKWTNKAKVSWGLTADLQTGILRKDEGSPYQDQPNGKDFIMVRDAMGNVTGFQFQGAFYRRIGE